VRLVRQHSTVPVIVFCLLAQTAACKAATPTLGTSPDTPVAVAGMGERDDWINEKICKGTPIRGYDIHDVAGKPTEIKHVMVECPAGAKHDLYFQMPHKTEADNAAEKANIQTDPRTPEVNAVLAKLWSRWGYSSGSELRDALSADPAQAPRNFAWLLSFVNDGPTQVEVWRSIIKREPSDMEANVKLPQVLGGLFRWDEAIAAAEAAPLDKLTLADTRGAAQFKASSILTNECLALVYKGDMARAVEKCKRSLELGSKAGANLTLAKISYEQGNAKDALTYIQAAAQASHEFDTEFVFGLITDNKPGSSEAAEHWNASIKSQSGFSPSRLALEGRQMAPKEWMALERKFFRSNEARDLATCWHIYTELEMPDRAKRCLETANGLESGPGQAEQLRHLGETNPNEALKQLMAAIKSSGHPALARETAVLLHRAGRDDEAIRWLDPALRSDPGDPRSRELLASLAGSSQSPEAFLDAYRKKAGANSTPPWK